MPLSDERQSDADEKVPIVVSVTNARLLRRLVQTAMYATAESLELLAGVDEKLYVVNRREQLYDIDDAIKVALILYEEDSNGQDQGGHRD